MMLRTFRLATLVLLPVLAACGDNDDDTGATDPDTFAPIGFDRTYQQIERLGNPLVSEVFIAKRNHGFHNKGAPSTDVANHADEIRAFVRTVAGRDATVQNTIATVLLPDMLIVQTDRAGTTAGWLSWALANGYGGRRLADDVVDAGLAAIFGPLLSPNNVTPQLASDNVGANDKAFGTTFPYLADPTP
ncbi:MAG: DUF4331 domain-containing protein [Gemmatimonadaceae bacterium]|nr:DUF4331 domain-containing protein [Gemmatimonadaceae bacterium]